ncbi:hypothetical protein [Nonomuraea sp. 10N515B]|uniref:hypothetical protein n=1 Tax=Nonomuraea sp. 10N515B TaxID=3457422 RepID=UPI003FCE9DEA
MVDGDHALARYGAGEADGAFACCQDWGGGGGGQVYAAVSGEPGLGRRGEAADNPGVAV